MELLFKTTTAYTTVCRDASRRGLSHAYLVWFADSRNLRYYLKLIALAMFGQAEQSPVGKRILNESFPDCKVYPEEGKKWMVDAAAEIIDDCALRPTEADKKVYVLSSFEQATPLVQNKLLKILEEPPQNVVFLLGATATAPLLNTVLSRVKLLSVPPFTAREVYRVLKRQFPQNGELEEVAQSCGGNLGVAQSMIGDGWFTTVHAAALEICTADTAEQAFMLSQKYGDTPYKTELLAEMQRLYFLALTQSVGSNGTQSVGESNSTQNVGNNATQSQSGNNEKEIAALIKIWQRPTLVFAESEVTRAAMDVKFNAFFAGLLNDFMVRVMEENEKWLKL
jgi:hypothetical protein